MRSLSLYRKLARVRSSLYPSLHVPPPFTIFLCPQDEMRRLSKYRGENVNARERARETIEKRKREKAITARRHRLISAPSSAATSRRDSRFIHLSTMSRGAGFNRIFFISLYFPNDPMHIHTQTSPHYVQFTIFPPITCTFVYFIFFFNIFNFIIRPQVFIPPIQV